MEYLFKYLKRNLKLAFKSVTFHFRQYFCFFIALFVIQSFFGIITMASDNSGLIEYAMYNEAYDYHIVLKDLNADQYVTIVNDEKTVFRKDHIHDIVRIRERDEKGAFNGKYDVYIRFLGDPHTSLNIFKIRYYEDLASLNENGLRVATSPLLTYSANRTANMVSYIFFSLLLAAVSVFLLISLYNIRLNHYKFTYGIYMSFGADFRKLVETSFWEMMMIALMTFLPASGFSAGVTYLIYHLAGESFTFLPSSILKVLGFSLAIAALAVLLPMKNLSLKTPMSLIISEDNSNLVISPRRSAEMQHRKFPAAYERLSLWRFRKYNLRLLLTATIFGVVFLWGLFYAHMYSCNLVYEQPQFTLTFKKTGYDYTYTDELKEEIYEIEGVTDIEKSLSTDAMSLRSHILLDSGDAAPFSNLVIYPYEKNTRVTNRVAYSPCDEETVDYLGRYAMIGDPSLVLTDDHAVIVSDSFDNTRKFSFSPGDTIRIATYVSRTRAATDYLNDKKLLKFELENYKFTYEEYTVAAVLLDNPTFEYMPLYMNPSAYEKLTDSSIEYRSCRVFVDDSLSAGEVESIHEQLRDWADYYGNIGVFNGNTLTLNRIETARQNTSVYIAVSCLVLVIAPLIWFMSQTLFYFKRENEYTILQAFGAVMSEIKKIYLADGIFDCIAGMFLTIVMNLAGVFAIYKFVNVVLPKFTQENIRYDFYVPLIPFLLSVLLSMVCGFLSAYIPWIIYEKKNRDRTSTDLSEE